MAKSRTPPQSEEAEMGAVACLLHQPQFVSEIYHGMSIQPSHFYNESLREIYCAVTEMVTTQKPCDLILVTAYLGDTNRLDKLAMTINKEAWRGAAFITQLFTFLDSPARAMDYAAILQKKLTARNALQTIQNAETRLYEQQQAEPESIITELIGNLETVTAVKDDQYKSLTESAIRSIERRMEDRAIGLSVEGLEIGIGPLDARLGGWLPQTYYVFAAPEKLGKSAMAESTIHKQTLEGRKTVTFERDMTVEKMVARIACRDAKIIFEDYHKNRLTDDQARSLRKSLRNINPDLLRIHSPEDMTAQQMIKIVRHEQRKGEIAVCFLDVFTRLYVRGDEYIQGLARASDAIRQSCGDLGVTWVVLAHVSHEGQKRPDGRPRIHDLKWCKGLAGDCDTFGLMWSEPQDDPKLKENKGKRQRIIFSFDANRDGESGDVQAYFDRPHMTFYANEEGPL